MSASGSARSSAALDVVLRRLRGRRAGRARGRRAGARGSTEYRRGRPVPCPSSTGARASMAASWSRSASRIAASAARASAYSRSRVGRPSPARPEPPARRPCALASARSSPRAGPVSAIGRRPAAILEPLRVDERGERLREAALAERCSSRARSARAAPWRARRSVGAPARLDPASGCASSNRPCADVDRGHRRQHHGGDRLGHPPVRLRDRDRLRGDRCRCLRERVPAGRQREMAEAADLDVGPADPPRERQALLQVSLGIVSRHRTTARRCRGSSARRLSRRCSAASSVTESRPRRARAAAAPRGARARRSPRQRARVQPGGREHRPRS